MGLQEERPVLSSNESERTRNVVLLKCEPHTIHSPSNLQRLARLYLYHSSFVNRDIAGI